MFNGIIKNTGRIKKIHKNGNNCHMDILSNLKFKKNEIGSSIDFFKDSLMANLPAKCCAGVLNFKQYSISESRKIF